MQVKDLIAQRERMFIEQRMLISQWVEQLMKNVSEISPELLSGITIPVGKTAQELLPSLYAEPFDVEVYEKEKQALEALQQALNALAIRLNQEALKCLSE